MSEQQQILPEKYPQFARDLAELCKRTQLESFTGTIVPSLLDGVHSEITFFWSRGRHGESAERICLTTTHRQTLNIQPAPTNGSK